MKPLNWSEAAAIVGKSRQALRDLVRRGVLTDCVVRDGNGEPIGVSDADALRDECALKVRQRAGGGGQEARLVAERAKRRGKPLRSAAQRKAPRPVAPEPPPPSRDSGDDVPEYNESRAKTEYEKSLLLEIERRQKEGQLVERESVLATWSQLITSAKGKLLGVPTTVRQRIPHLSAEEADLIDAVIREALEGLTMEAGCNG
jgi:hypothetical protein